MYKIFQLIRLFEEIRGQAYHEGILSLENRVSLENPSWLNQLLIPWIDGHPGNFCLKFVKLYKPFISRLYSAKYYNFCYQLAALLVSDRNWNAESAQDGFKLAVKMYGVTLFDYQHWLKRREMGMDCTCPTSDETEREDA